MGNEGRSRHAGKIYMNPLLCPVCVLCLIGNCGEKVLSPVMASSAPASTGLTHARPPRVPHPVSLLCVDFVCDSMQSLVPLRLKSEDDWLVAGSGRKQHVSQNSRASPVYWLSALRGSMNSNSFGLGALDEVS